MGSFLYGFTDTSTWPMYVYDVNVTLNLEHGNEINFFILFSFFCYQRDRASLSTIYRNVK